MADEAELQRLIAGNEMAYYINRKAGPQATGVLSSLALVAQSLRLLPRQEDADAPSLWNATDCPPGAQGLNLRHIKEHRARGTASAALTVDRHSRHAPAQAP